MHMRRRVISCILGYCCIAVSIFMAVKSRIGVSPLSMVPYTAATILGVELGTTQLFYYSSLVLLQIPILGRRFKPVRLTQFAVAILISSVVTAAQRLFPFELPDFYPPRLAMQIGSILICSVGIFLNVSANLVYNAPEGIMHAISERFGFKFGNVKVAVDSSLVLIAVVAGLIFLGGPVGLREGTLMAALFTGKIIGFIQFRVGERMRRYHFGDAPDDKPAPPEEPGDTASQTTAEPPAASIPKANPQPQEEAPK